MNKVKGWLLKKKHLNCRFCIYYKANNKGYCKGNFCIYIL